MAIETTTSSPEIQEVTWMRPKVRILPLISKKSENYEGSSTVFGKGLDIAQRVISHRLDLVPIDLVDLKVFDRRKQNTGYIYRQGRRGGDAHLVFESFGNREKGRKHKKKGAYQIKTSWMARHPVLLTSFALHHGKWALVTFDKPFVEPEKPPERLPFPRREKPQRSRSM